MTRRAGPARGQNSLNPERPRGPQSRGTRRTRGRVEPSRAARGTLSGIVPGAGAAGGCLGVAIRDWMGNLWETGGWCFENQGLQAPYNPHTGRCYVSVYVIGHLLSAHTLLNSVL